MKKTLLYLFLSFYILSNNSTSAINNSGVKENTNIQLDSINKTSQEYYNEAKELEKESSEHSKRGFIFLIIGISVFLISGVIRKKKKD